MSDRERRAALRAILAARHAWEIFGLPRGGNIVRSEVQKQYRAMADKARRERDLMTETAIKNLEPEVVKQRIEAGPAAMAKNLMKSAVDLATGGVTDPKARMEICNVCPFKSPDGRCGKCGCVLAAKTRVKKSSCPIGRW